MEDAAQVNALLEAMATYSPTIPEELVEYYLQQAGFVTNDVRITRMISLAAHKLILDVTHDAMQYQRIRAQSASSAPTAGSSSPASPLALLQVDGGATTGSRTVLTMDDLAARYEFGVNICKPEYVSDAAQDPAA
ncbi:hypothetical protein BBJ28_00021790 [Nothophytophthora sp. Chile5]|nr:hypothetical protein BBJ28_00021790 [Nothophytophthora sp. Chile5]